MGGAGGGGGGRRAVKERASPADFPRTLGGGGGGRGRRGGGGGGGGGRGTGERVVKTRPSAESKAVHEAYGPIETGSRKEPPLIPIV